MYMYEYYILHEHPSKQWSSLTLLKFGDPTGFVRDNMYVVIHDVVGDSQMWNLSISH